MPVRLGLSAASRNSTAATTSDAERLSIPVDHLEPVVAFNHRRVDK